MSDTPTPRTDAVFKMLSISNDIRYNYERRKVAKEGARNGIEELERELQQKDAQIAFQEKQISELNQEIGRAKHGDNGYATIAEQRDTAYAQIAALRGALSEVLEITTPMTPSIDSIIEASDEAEDLWKIHLICHYAALSSPPPPVVPQSQYDELKADADGLADALEGLYGVSYVSKSKDYGYVTSAVQALETFRAKHPQQEKEGA